MNRKLWNWDPKYSCISHKIISLDSDSFSGDEEEWQANSVLKKTYND